MNLIQLFEYAERHLKAALLLLALALPAAAQFTNAKSIWSRPIDSASPTNGYALVWNSSQGKWTFGAVGAGTLTNLTFTGGIISVANPTTTPALTVAGTSGGIPYFSSGTTWASSAAWTANTLMKGGGAGVAPIVTGITVDSSNVLSSPAGARFCVGCSTAGAFEFGEGTAPSIETATIISHAPVSVTGYRHAWPSGAATGFRLWTNSSNTVTESIVSFTGTGDVARATSPTVTGLNSNTYSTATNCSSSAAPAVCAAAAAGSVVVAASATTVVVNTTAVTANSQILLMYDSSLGTKLSVTCNVTEPALYGVTARTASTSFTITATASVTNPACFSFIIFN